MTSASVIRGFSDKDIAFFLQTEPFLIDGV